MTLVISPFCKMHDPNMDLEYTVTLYNIFGKK